MTLNNLANLRNAENEFPAAEAGYQEACDSPAPGRGQPADLSAGCGEDAQQPGDFAIGQERFSRRRGRVSGGAGYLPPPGRSQPAGLSAGCSGHAQQPGDFATGQERFRRRRGRVSGGPGDLSALGRGQPTDLSAEMAITLNNLAILQKARNDFPAAETGIRRPWRFAAAWPRPTRRPTCRMWRTRSTTWPFCKRPGTTFPPPRPGIRRPWRLPPPGRGQPADLSAGCGEDADDLATLQEAKNEFVAAEAGISGGLRFVAAWLRPSRHLSGGCGGNAQQPGGIAAGREKFLPPKLGT